MLGAIGATWFIASIVLITLRFCLKRSDKKRILRLLTILWIVCLVIGGICLAVQAAETYVAPRAVYKGYWYDSHTGAKIRNEYDLVGGNGSHPVFMFFMTIFSFTVWGAVIGAAVIGAKEKAKKAKMGISKVFSFALFFIVYTVIGILSIGIYSIFLVKKL